MQSSTEWVLTMAFACAGSALITGTLAYWLFGYVPVIGITCGLAITVLCHLIARLYNLAKVE